MDGYLNFFYFLDVLHHVAMLGGLVLTYAHFHLPWADSQESSGIPHRHDLIAYSDNGAAVLGWDSLVCGLDQQERWMSSFNGSH